MQAFEITLEINKGVVAKPEDLWVNSWDPWNGGKPTPTKVSSDLHT